MQKEYEKGKETFWSCFFPFDAPLQIIISTMRRVNQKH